MFKNKKTFFILSTMVIIISVLVAIIWLQQKVEATKCAFDRGAYYRLENLERRTKETLVKINNIGGSTKVSISDIAELRLLNSMVSQELWYLNLEVYDYNWKINKIKDYENKEELSPDIIDFYCQHLKEIYSKNTDIDFEKESEAFQIIRKYYYGIQEILDGKSVHMDNIVAVDKEQLINMGKWIDMTFELNKYHKDFWAKNREMLFKDTKLK